MKPLELFATALIGLFLLTNEAMAQKSAPTTGPRIVLLFAHPDV